MKTAILIISGIVLLLVLLIGPICLIARPWTFHNPPTSYEKYTLQMATHAVCSGVIVLSLGSTFLMMVFFRRR